MGPTFPVSILREGIAHTSHFLAKPNDTRSEDHFKTLQLFDDSKEEWARGKGHLFAATGVQACYFYCDAFEVQGFSVHAAHLSYLTNFLAKATGNVSFKLSPNMTYVSDANGNVLGWTRETKPHGKFGYYSMKMDKFVLAVDRAEILAALKYTRKELDSKRDRIRLRWDNESKALRFDVSEANAKATSFPVAARVIESEDRAFTTHADINQFIEMFEGVKSNDVELRIALIPVEGGKEKAMFRTIDKFLLDSEGKVVVGGNPDAEQKPDGTYRCKVTRFMPSKE